MATTAKTETAKVWLILACVYSCMYFCGYKLSQFGA